MGILGAKGYLDAIRPLPPLYSPNFLFSSFPPLPSSLYGTSGLKECGIILFSNIHWSIGYRDPCSPVHFLCALFAPAGVGPNLPDASSTPVGPSLGSLCSTLALPTVLSAAHKPSSLVLSPALPPVPVKVVEKAQARAFVDLKDLLPDNMAVR